MSELPPNTACTGRREFGAILKQLSRFKSSVLPDNVHALPAPVTQFVRAPESSRKLERKQSDKKDPRHVFKEFGEIYTQASPEARRRIINIIIEEIRCSVKRGERKGDIVYKLRGDGSVKKEWEQARQHEDPNPPSFGDSGLQCAWLRERLENSNYILLRIPVEIHLFQRGL